MRIGSEIENPQTIIVKLKQQMSSLERVLQSIYIPLQGAYATNSEEKSFDLTSKLKDFFEFRDDNPRDSRVMLLLGDAGSGKSFFAQQLVQEMWQTFEHGQPILVWIPLLELDSHFVKADEEVLKKCGLTEAQIETLKSTERFFLLWMVMMNCIIF